MTMPTRNVNTLAGLTVLTPRRGNKIDILEDGASGYRIYRHSTGKVSMIPRADVQQVRAAYPSGFLILHGHAEAVLGKQCRHCSAVAAIANALPGGG
jgi:hypothetical protein